MRRSKSSNLLPSAILLMPLKNIEARRLYQRQYHKQYYADNVHVREAKIATVKAHRKELQQYVLAYRKSHPCVDCGESDPIVLDFDHLHNKDRSISEAVKRGWSIERLQREIDKCQIRCANCHRRKTEQFRV